MPVILTIKDKIAFDKLASHPLQSWCWGEFRKKTGIEVIRLGRYEKDKLIETAQITIHSLPFTSYRIGYFPKGRIPSKEMLNKLIEIGKIYNCIFIKLEPNIEKNDWELAMKNWKITLVPSAHPLFTKYTFQLDLNKTDEEILKGMHPKTRYNIKVAQKHGITVQENNSDQAFSEYLHLTFETTKRQKFFAHNKNYHQLMWETLKAEGMAHLLTATYPKEGNIVLAAWILFFFNGVIYYPYGASSGKFRNTMASNLLMWEAIKWGKRKGAKLFDMWGSLGPNPDIKDPWYGFHRFKQGYNPRLVEFAGSFDLVINPALYNLYNVADRLRKAFLKIKSHINL